MADNEYQSIAEQIAAEKGLADLGSNLDEMVDNIIADRYYFVHGDYPTERNAETGYGTYAPKPRGQAFPVRNMRLSNTRMPSKSMKTYSPVGGDPVEAAADDEVREKNAEGLSDEDLLAALLGTADETAIPNSDGGEVYPESWSGDRPPKPMTAYGVNPDIGAGQAGVPWMKAQRTANRDLQKIYDLLDQGVSPNDPQILELRNGVLEDIKALATGGTKATGGLSKSQKTAREQMGP